MKLHELLGASKLTGDIIVRQKDNLSMRYSDVTKSFVYCDSRSGQLFVSKDDKTRLNQVVLSDKLLTDDWYLTPIQKSELQTKGEIIKEVIRDLTTDLNVEYIKASTRQIDGRKPSGFMNGLECATQIVNKYNKK